MKTTCILMSLFLISTFVRAQKSKDTLFYPYNKTIKSITTVDKNKKIIESYNNQSKLESKVQFVNNQLDGLTIRYNYNGLLAEETEYKNGYKNGESKVYFNSGTINSITNYKNDTIHGFVTKYYEIGTIQSKESFTKNYKFGKCEYYFKSGKPSAVYIYDTVIVNNGSKKNKSSVNSVLDGKCQTWYESGNKKTLENYVRGKKNGGLKQWNEKGQLTLENNYVNDYRCGRQLTYFANGNLNEDITIELEYDSLKKYYKTFYKGTYLQYDESKNPRTIGFYKNRKKQGKWQYFANGKITVDAEYKDDYLINEYKSFHSNTNLLERKQFYKPIKINTRDTSALDGESVSYYRDGKVSSKSIYNNGRCIHSISYFNNDVMSSQCSISDSLVYKTDYYKNGNIERKSIAKYDKDKDVTAQKYDLMSLYYENGILKQEFYIGLNPIKIKKQYNDSGLVIHQKYNVTDDIGIETDFYNSGKLKSEQVVLQNSYKTIGLQYIEWFENEKPKRFEVYGLYQINWLSNGEFYSCYRYKNNNPNLQEDTMINAFQISEIYNTLIKYSKKTIQLEGVEGKTFSMYDNKKIKIEAFVEKGVITNYLRAYYFSGKPMIEFTLKDGKLNGEYNLFSEKGFKLKSGNYCHGKLCGEWLECNFNGDTVSYYVYNKPTDKKGYYNNYKFKNDYYVGSEDGKQKPHLRSHYEYKDDKMDGFQIEYHPNGNLNYQKQMVKGVNIGHVETFWHTGYLCDNSTLDSLGQKQGHYQRGYQNGNLQTDAYYKDNKLQGAYKFYWPNGKLRFEGKYELDKKVGEWKTLDSNGVLLKKENFTDGVNKSLAEANSCNCKTTQSKIGYAGSISDLMDITRADIWQFPFHESISKYLKSLFYLNYQTSQSRDGSTRFTSLDLVCHSELIIGLPNEKGLQFVVNPCSKFQNISRVPCTFDITKNEPNQSRIEFNPEMVAFRFNKKLLTPSNLNVKETEAFFKSTLSYTKQGLKLYKAESLCFTPSLLSNTKAVITLSSFIPSIKEQNNRIEFIQADFLAANKIIKGDGFYGISNGKGTLTSSIGSKVVFPLSHVIITNTAFAGEIILNQTVSSDSNKVVMLNNVAVSETSVIDILKSLLDNTALIKSKIENEKLIMSFIINTKN